MSAVASVTELAPGEPRPTGTLALRSPANYKYAHLLPTWPEDEHYPPLTPFEHVDPGSRALKHPNPRSILETATSAVDLTPHLGTEYHGLNLAELSNDGRDQLALEVARRGVLVFRDQQDFIDRGPDFYLQWGSYFGRNHIHPTSGHPAGYPELHLIYRDASLASRTRVLDRVSDVDWHTDISYERQPPGLTTLFLLAQPPTGGDTAFTSQVRVLRSLSPAFVAFLRTLAAVHSAVEQATFARVARTDEGQGVVRREPVENVHPVVRRHPVTGEEALYVNKSFTRRIVGLKREESDTILNFLFNHIDKSLDNQVRLKWSPNTVVLWDNRVTSHAAIGDYENQSRHGARITPQAERPIPALEGLDLNE